MQSRRPARSRSGLYSADAVAAATSSDDDLADADQSSVSQAACSLARSRKRRWVVSDILFDDDLLRGNPDQPMCRVVWSDGSVTAEPCAVIMEDVPRLFLPRLQAFLMASSPPVASSRQLAVFAPDFLEIIEAEARRMAVALARAIHQTIVHRTAWKAARRLFHVHGLVHAARKLWPAPPQSAHASVQLVRLVAADVESLLIRAGGSSAVAADQDLPRVLRIYHWHTVAVEYRTRDEKYSSLTHTDVTLSLTFRVWEPRADARSYPTDGDWKFGPPPWRAVDDPVCQDIAMFPVVLARRRDL